MKRSAELRDLSEQHHYGLVAARRLRRAARGELPLAESLAQFREVWRGEIQPHFRTEEEILLPAYAQAVPPDDARIVRALTEHVALRWAVRELDHAGPDSQPVLAGDIAQSLDDHIRFEERVLFPAIEAALEGPRLIELGRELSASAQNEVNRTAPVGMGSVSDSPEERSPE